MGEIEITPRDRTFVRALPTGQRHLVRIRRFKVDLVELEDAHFHPGSAVMLPERDPEDATDARSGDMLTGLLVLRTVLLHAAKHPKKKLLCAGHTDRSGPRAQNLELSDWRATNVRALLTGDVDAWVATCMKRHGVHDQQAILKWIANVRYWPDCDPGAVDGVAGKRTRAATRAFKKRFSAALGGKLAHDATVDASVWRAFFRMYAVALAGILQTDEADLGRRLAALTWLSPASVGCGAGHPLTPRTAGRYRSSVDQRVELMFFDPGEEPRLDACHPEPGTCAPMDCEIYRKTFIGRGFYTVRPVTVETSAKVSLRLTEVRGLYKPGFSDPADVAEKTQKRAGYEKGYKSDDDQGRIYVNQIPRVDASIDWDAVKKKNQQYIELGATIDVEEGTLPPDAQVVWTWSDPDDPSDAGMRSDAAEEVDPNDFESGTRKSQGVDGTGDDNLGTCDFPTPKAGRHPAFERIGPYALTPAADHDRHCLTLISGGQSQVRLHCTDAGGDNFRVTAAIRSAPNLQVTDGDQTGTMTMWKRIDVEYRKMPDAEDLPVNDIVPLFEPQFIQMDVMPMQPTKRNDRYALAPWAKDPETKFVENEFAHYKKPGWFFVCAARESDPPAGRPRMNLYEGPARLIEDPLARATSRMEEGHFDLANLTRFESIVVNGVLVDDAAFVTFREGTQEVTFYAWSTRRNRPVAGKTTIRLIPIDYNSDFESADGSWRRAYAKRAMYYPRFRYRWPENKWERRGYGFEDDVYVSIMSRGRSVTAGLSPGARNKAGRHYFAGRTMIFTRHPHFTKSAHVKWDVRGQWKGGDEVEIAFEGRSAFYLVMSADASAPAGTPDPDFYVQGQVARGIEWAINEFGPWSESLGADSSFGSVDVRAASQGNADDGKPITVSVNRRPGSTGTIVASASHLGGGGFMSSASDEILQILTHELGHAFGFSHKCGYLTPDEAGKSCTMNYRDTWTYKRGTPLDPAGREVERFKADMGLQFCARHGRGMRKARLEDNPEIWSW